MGGILKTAVSFNGRAGRETFWKTGVILALLFWIMVLLVRTPLQPLAFLLMAGLLWPLAAVCVKRCHDRNKTGWRALLALIPVAGQLWLLVELGCFPGTRGPNRFGREEKSRQRHTVAGQNLPGGYPDFVCMLTKLAKCDGRITAGEIAAAHRSLFHLLPPYPGLHDRAFRDFRSARDSPLPFEVHARRFLSWHGTNRELLGKAIDALVSVALADGRPSRKKLLFLDRAVAVFGMETPAYQHCRGGRIDSEGRDAGPGAAPDPEEREHARILGLSGRTTREELRATYRRLVAQYHPDKVSHLGPRLREVADQEIKKINEAYEYFRKKYDL